MNTIVRNTYFVVVEMSSRQLILSEESKDDFPTWVLQKRHDASHQGYFSVGTDELSTLVHLGQGSMVVSFMTTRQFQEIRRASQLAAASHGAKIIT